MCTRIMPYGKKINVDKFLVDSSISDVDNVYHSKNFCNELNDNIDKNVIMNDDSLYQKTIISNIYLT